MRERRDAGAVRVPRDGAPVRRERRGVCDCVRCEGPMRGGGLPVADMPVGGTGGVRRRRVTEMSGNCCDVRLGG